MDDEDKQISELYEAFGLAMYQAQSLEREIAILLVTAQAGRPSRLTLFQLEDLYEKSFRRTLGPLIHAVRREIPLHVNLEKRLFDALETRNFLVHNYFWERAGEVQTTEGRASMIKELRQFADDFDRLDNELTPISSAWARHLGVTVEVQMHHLEQLKTQAIKNSKKRSQPTKRKDQRSVVEI